LDRFLPGCNFQKPKSGLRIFPHEDIKIASLSLPVITTPSPFQGVFGKMTEISPVSLKAENLPRPEMILDLSRMFLPRKLGHFAKIASLEIRIFAPACWRTDSTVRRLRVMFVVLKNRAAGKAFPMDALFSVLPWYHRRKSALRGYFRII
jgi:hypothetical protein